MKRKSSSDPSRIWDSLVDAFVDPGESGPKQAANVKRIIQLVRDEVIGFHDIVTAAKKHLRSPNASIRARGVLLLGDLLANLSSTPLEDTVIQSLAQLLTALFEDQPCLREVLIGCCALLKRSPENGAMEGRDVQKMVEAMLTKIDVEKLEVDDRLCSLELFECILIHHSDSVPSLHHSGSDQSLGARLIIQVRNAIWYERDRRCLLVAFRLVVHFGRVFSAPNRDGPLKEDAEHLFGAIAHQFPVSPPPPDDTLGISRDALANALLDAFASTTLFAVHCISFLIGKLDLEDTESKLDTLRYLGSCLLTYGSAAIIDDAWAIWMALKKELLPAAASKSRDAPHQEEALRSLTRYVRAFDKENMTTTVLEIIWQDGCIQKLLEYVRKDFRNNSREREGSSDTSPGASESNDLTSGEKEEVQAIGCMLAATMKASASACLILTEKLLSPLLTATGDLYRGVPQLSVCGLNVVIQIVQAAGTVANKIAPSQRVSGAVSAKWLEPVRSEASSLFLTFDHIVRGQRPMTANLSLGVAGLEALASFPVSMSILSRDKLLSSLLSLGRLLDNGCPRYLRDRVNEAFYKISSTVQ